MKNRWNWLIASCLVASVKVHASTLTVPTDHSDIGAAMAAAKTGDTVRVLDGVYEEKVSLKDGVRLEGTGRDRVTVRCPAEESPLLRIADCASGVVRGIRFEATGRTEQGEARPDHSPIIDIANSAVEVTDCEILGSAGSGVRIAGAGPASVNGCTVRDNRYAGIQVTGAAQPSLAENAIHGNQFGICFTDRATGAARGNTCTNNTGHGILVEGDGVAPVLSENMCSENGWSGIYFGLGAQGKAEKNHATSNVGNGIVVMDVDTTPEIVDNVLEDNACYGLWIGRGTKVKYNGNTYTRNGLISSAEVTRLVYERNFDDLETIVDRLRKDKIADDSGYWQLSTYYDSLGDYAGSLRPEDVEEYLKLIDEWRETKQKSVAPVIVKARAQLSLAWRERGGGWARDVTDEGWEGYRRYGKLAWDTALEAERMGVADPDLYLLKAQAAQVTGQGSGMSFKEIWNSFADKRVLAINEFIEAGFGQEPTYLNYCGEQVRQLLPRWGGSEEEVEAFAAWAVQHGGKEMGDALYAVVATHAARFEDVEVVVSSYPFNPSRMLGGYRDLVRLYPKSTYWKNWAARMAGVYNDRAMAHEMFALIGNNRDEGVWSGAYHFQRWSDWAEGKGRNPRINPLSQAVLDGDTDRVKRLVRNGADPNTLTESGNSLLSVALENEDFEMAQVLLQNGTDVNLDTPEGTPPLLWAVWQRDSTALDLLLPYRPNPNVQDSEGRTPLVSMANRPDARRVCLLLDLGADPAFAPRGRTALHGAARQRDTEAIAALLEKGADPNARDWSQYSALYVATQQNDIAACKLMLDKGGDPNASHGDGWSPMFEAVEQANLDMLKLLVSYGGDVTRVEKSGWSMFHTAASAGSVPVLQYLLEQHPEGLHFVTDTKRGLLHHAAKNGHVEMVKFLLDMGLDPRAEDSKGKTPLTEAAKYPKVVQLLEGQGSDS